MKAKKYANGGFARRHGNSDTLGSHWFWHILRNVNFRVEHDGYNNLGLYPVGFHHGWRHCSLSQDKSRRTLNGDAMKTKLFSRRTQYAPLFFIVLLVLSLGSVVFIHSVKATTTETITINVPAWCPSGCYVFVTDNTNGQSINVYSGQTGYLTINYGDYCMFDGVANSGNVFSYFLTNAGFVYSNPLWGHIWASFALTCVFGIASKPSPTTATLMVTDSGGGYVNWVEAGNATTFGENNFTIESGSSCTFTAVPNSNYIFKSFYYQYTEHGLTVGGVSTDNPFVYTVTYNYTIVSANFSPISPTPTPTTTTTPILFGNLKLSTEDMTILTMIGIFALIFGCGGLGVLVMKSALGGLVGINIGVILGYAIPFEYGFSFIPIWGVIIMIIIDAVYTTKGYW
jgi:hypothetical protein